MIFDVAVLLAGAVLIVGGWLIMYWFYRRIHNVRVKWWAIPLTHGAVMGARRLPAKWEKPL